MRYKFKALLAMNLLLAGVAFGQDDDSAKSNQAGATPAAVDERLTNLKGQVDGINEDYLETKGTVNKLAKIKVSGYLQLQWQHADSNGIGSVAGGNFPGNSNQRMQLRRGRLKTTYDAGLSQYMLELEVVPSGVSLKDAEAVITEPWLKTFTLGAGVMDRPFGFEIPYSSSAHEAPERTRVFQTVFPGEKDLGARLEINPTEKMGLLQYLNFKGGVFTGTSSASTPSNAVNVVPTRVIITDSLGKKDTTVANLPNGKTAAPSNGDEIDSTVDIIGRLGFKAPFNELNLAIDGGVSFYAGKSLSTNDTVYADSSGIALIPTKGNKNKTFARNAYGVDMQLYYDIPVIGGLSLRGEYLTGQMPGTVASSKPFGSSGSATGIDFPNSYMAIRKFAGYYVSWIQNVGSKVQTVVKYDVYDPNTKVSGSTVGLPGTGRLGKEDLKYTTIGAGVLYYWDENVRFTAYYDKVTNEKVAGTVAPASSLYPYTKDLKDNVFTLRMQVKF